MRLLAKDFSPSFDFGIFTLICEFNFCGKDFHQTVAQNLKSPFIIHALEDAWHVGVSIHDTLDPRVNCIRHN